MTTAVRLSSVLPAEAHDFALRPQTARWPAARRALQTPGVRGRLEEAVHDPRLRPGTF